MSVTLLCGDVRLVLRGRPAESVHLVVTSVPYWGLRAYGTNPQVWGGSESCAHVWETERTPRINGGGGKGAKSKKQTTNQGAFITDNEDRATYSDFCAHCGAWRGELGLEPTVGLYIEHLVEVFREVRRVLRRDGTCWVNIGDCYAGTPNGWDAGKYRERGIDDRTFRDKPFATTGGGLKPKDLALVPQRLAIALQEDGWWVRSDVIWHKPNPLPESIGDRPTKSHEYLWMLARSEDYYYDAEAVKEPAAGTTLHDLTGPGYDAPGQTKQNGNRAKAVGPVNKLPEGRNGTDGRSKPHAAGPAGSVGKYDPIAEARYDNGENGLHGGVSYEGVGSSTRKFGADPAKRNRRTVWTIPTQPYRGAHFACVDEATEALTLDGWKDHSELQDGEPIAAYDPATGRLSWESATFHRYDYDGELVAIEKRDSSQRLTPNHRCLVKTRHGNVRVVRADELTPGMQIPTAAPFRESAQRGIGRLWASLLGWYIAEGSSHHPGYVYIYQSETANPEHVKTIRRLLTEIGAEARERVRTRIWRGRESREVEWSITGDVAARLQTLAPRKTLTTDLALLPPEDAAALLEAFIDGDGHRRADGRCCVIQKDRQCLELLQVIALRLGYRAHVRPRGERDYCLYLTKGQWLTLRGTDGKHTPLATVPYRGVVWCPSVPSGFWLARRDGKPFITGNTFPERLVEPCILAGTSAHGVCGLCGAPWERLKEPTPEYAALMGSNEGADADRYGAGYRKHSPAACADYATTGWRPTCDCHPAFAGDPVPATVLDPFCGSGTTCVVAERHGRDSVGVDLSPEYLELAGARIGRALLAAVARETPGGEAWWRVVNALRDLPKPAFSNAERARYDTLMAEVDRRLGLETTHG